MEEALVNPALALFRKKTYQTDKIRLILNEVTAQLAQQQNSSKVEA